MARRAIFRLQRVTMVEESKDSNGTEAPKPLFSDEVAAPTGQHYTWRQAWWKALTRPTPATFRQLLADPEMALRRALWWVAAAAVLAAALAPVGQTKPGNYAHVQDWVVITLTSSATTVLIGLALPLVLTRVADAAAKALGGAGANASLFYAFAAIYAPVLVCAFAIWNLVLIIVAAPSGQPPAVIEFVYEHDDALRILLLVYGLIGLASATRAVYGLTWGRALISAWVSVIGSLLLFYGCAALPLLAVMGGVFG